MQLRRHLDEIEERITRARYVALISDYDGTLTPIVSHPDLAILGDETRALLQDLAALDRMHVAIVSGRALEDLESKVGLHLTYAGNHGLEIECPLGRFREPRAASLAPVLQEIVAQLHKDLDSLEGVVLENKGLTASVHYRKAHPELDQVIHSLTAKIVRQQDDRFVLREGKKVIEIRPAISWNKGSAALYILERLPPGTLSICLGDDLTDEDMFRALKSGITVAVGPGYRSNARYCVDDVTESVEFLTFLKEIMVSSEVCDPGRRLR